MSRKACRLKITSKITAGIKDQFKFLGPPSDIQRASKRKAHSNEWAFRKIAFLKQRLHLILEEFQRLGGCFVSIRRGLS